MIKLLFRLLLISSVLYVNVSSGLESEKTKEMGVKTLKNYDVTAKPIRVELSADGVLSIDNRVVGFDIVVAKVRGKESNSGQINLFFDTNLPTHKLLEFVDKFKKEDIRTVIAAKR